MTFEVFPELGLLPGVYAITVTNASGRSATVGNALAVVPRPSVTTVVPDLVCTEQYENTVTVNGVAFLRIGSTLPTVTIGPRTYTPVETLGCAGIAGPVTNAELCTGLRVAIPQDDLDSVAPENLSPHDVVVVNPMPAECRSTEAKRLTVVPRPRLARIEADLVCAEQFANDMVLTGTDFFVIAGVLPTVRIGPRTYTPTAEGCTSLGGFDEAVDRCTTLRVTVPQGDLAPAVHRVEVANPTPVQCQSTDAVGLLVVPRPTVTDVEPDLVCREQLTNLVTVRGTDFLTVDGTPPQVTIGPQTFSGASVVPTAASCAAVAGLRETVLRCTELVVTVPAGVLAAGPNPVTVQNPMPAHCQSTDAFNLVAVDRPMVTGVSRPALCVAQGPQTLLIQGSGFLQIGSETPAVTLGTRTYTSAAGDCTLVAGTTAQVCNQLSITVPQDDLPPGEYTLTVTNPAPAACQSTDTVMVRITTPPTGVALVGADPRLCEGGGILTITGTGFQDGAVANLSLPGGPSVDAGMNVVSPDGTMLTATFGRVPPSAQRYTLAVRNPDGCSASASNTVQVTTGIFVFFVDPPVVYNGVSTKITILGTGVSAKPSRVSLVGAQSTIEYSGSDIEWGGDETPARPQRTRVVVAEGTAVGTYSVGLTAQIDGSFCDAFLPNALVVTDQTLLAVNGITPPFGWQGEDTAVILTAKATADLAAGEVNFRPIPRAYLSPSVGAGTATEMRAVDFVSETRLTGVAPNRSSGLAPGDYDVIVVNPAGEVGVLLAAYKVTADPPPIVDSVSPGTLRTNPTPQPATVNGQSFRPQAVVTLRCRLPGSTTDVVPTVDTGAIAPDGTQIAISVHMGNLMEGMICVVRVTNSDGSFFDFSAVGVANPAQGANPLSFQAGPNLNEPRRAPAGAAARVTRTARFLYAIGGDSGTAAGALQSAEAATVGLFGDVGSWFRLPPGFRPVGVPVSPALPEKRTLAGGVRVGGFLFLVGGHDGTATTTKVLRAQVLLPEEAPIMGDPDLSVDEDSEDPSEGLENGLWSYRVSAVLPGNQAHNPGGETLASEPLLVRVPQLGFPVTLRVCWRPPTQPGGVAVQSYRLYRTALANGTPGQEKLLVECPESAECQAGVPARCYDDKVPDPAQFADVNLGPLPLGSTGVWHEVAALGTARASAGVGAVSGIQPATMGGPVRAAIYAIGGTSDGSAGLRSSEVLVLNADGTMPSGAWSAGPDLPMNLGRFELQLFIATAVNAPKVGSNVWIYAGGGRGMAMASTAVEAAQVDLATGALGTWAGVADFIGGGRAGYAAALSNDFLYVVVGQSGGNLVDRNDKAEITTPPTLQPWNSSPGDVRPRVRYLPGSTIQSAFWYLYGGATDTAAAVNTMDLSVFGGQP
jgi:hypothetical protein